MTTTAITMNELIAAATAKEVGQCNAMRAWAKAGRVGPCPEIAPAIAAGTVAGRAVECRATATGNGEHVTIRWKLDGKASKAAIIAAL